MPFRVLENPAPKENLIHNMEHGGVVVWVNTTNQSVYDQLADLVRDELDKRHFVVMSRYSEMEAETIALTSWTRLEKMSTANFDKDEIRELHLRERPPLQPRGFLASLRGLASASAIQALVAQPAGGRPSRGESSSASSESAKSSRRLLALASSR